MKDRWNSLPQDVPYGRDVRKFLEAIGEFAKLQTNRPSASYVPGITGIAKWVDLIKRKNFIHFVAVPWVRFR